MRSITFGPISYHESRLRDSDNDDLAVDVPLSASVDRNQQMQSSRLNEVIFYASENLFRESFVGHRELAMKKYCKCKFTFDPQRTFQSYCFEFCGLLNLQHKDVKFYLGSREAPLQRLVRKACVIEVFNANANSTKSGANALQPAFKELLDKALYSDIELVVNGEPIKAHKCVLMARSEKFKALVESNMRESLLNRVEVDNTELKSYRLLLQWIYEGECDLPDSVLDLISLLNLSDEYLLSDLAKVCEDHAVEHMDGHSALEVLTNPGLVFPG